MERWPRSSDSVKKAKIVLLAGGASKNLPFEAFGKMIQATCKYVVLFEGTATDDLAQAIGTSLPSTRVKSMKEAMQAASSVAQKGEIVCSPSPAAPASRHFQNEFDRGISLKPKWPSCNQCQIISASKRPPREMAAA